MELLCRQARFATPKKQITVLFQAPLARNFESPLNVGGADCPGLDVDAGGINDDLL